MTTIDCRDTLHTESTLAALATRAVEKVAGLYRAWANRRALYSMGAMSDIELADIGLSRADLFTAREEPFHRDPTGRLGALADINRRQSAARCIA